jgi:hypothetical protein
LHTIDPVTFDITSTQPISFFNGAIQVRLLQSRSANIKLQGEKYLYIHLEYDNYASIRNQRKVLIKYDITLQKSLLEMNSDEVYYVSNPKNSLLYSILFFLTFFKFCYTTKDFIFTSSSLSDPDIIQVCSKSYSGANYRDLSNSALSSINQLVTPTVCLQYVETKHGAIKWRSCFGQGDDTEYRKVGAYGNRIYLVYESKTGTFGTGDQDFMLSIVDMRTGVEIDNKVYGSTRDDTVLDMLVNQFGVYVMANLGNGFKDKDASDDYSTQNGVDNFALIFMDYDGNIQEIESYDTTDVANDLNGDYPKELIIARKDKQELLYAFLSYRDHDDLNFKGGFYLTYPADQQALFVTENSLAVCSGVSPNCELCSNSVCFKWEDGYKIQNGICKSAWDDYFYHQYDDLSDDTKDIDICLPCHETCKTWSDGTARGCLTWAADKVYDSTYKTCTCDTSTANKYLGLNGVWVSACNFGLAATKANACYRTWPSDSDNYSSTKGAVATEKSTSFSWYTLDRHLYFEEGTTEVLKSVNARERYLDQFTFTFWIYINQSSHSAIPILGNTDVFSINLLKDGSNSLALQLSIFNATDNTTSTYNGSYSFALQEWTYWGISFYKTNRFDDFYDINIVTKTESGITSNIEYTNIEMYFNWSTLKPPETNYHYLLVGQSGYNTTALFSGYLNMLFRFTTPHSTAEMLSNSHRSPVQFSSVYEESLNLALIITNDNTSEYIGKVYDYSQEGHVINLSDYSSPPTLIDFLSSPINLCTFYQIIHCLSLSSINSPILYSDESHLSTHANLIEDGSFSIQPEDGFAIGRTLDERGKGETLCQQEIFSERNIFGNQDWSYW